MHKTLIGYDDNNLDFTRVEESNTGFDFCFVPQKLSASHYCIRSKVPVALEACEKVASHLRKGIFARAGTDISTSLLAQAGEFLKKGVSSKYILGCTCPNGQADFLNTQTF